MSIFTEHDFEFIDQLYANEYYENNLSLAERKRLLEAHGSQSSAYFTLQEGVSHFGIPSIGYVAYFVQRSIFSSYNIAFTRPVCADENLELLIQFTERYTGRKTLYLAVDEATANALGRCGYNVNEIGTEFEIALPHFSLRGKEMKQLRWANNLCKRGFEVKEQRWKDIDETRVREISQQWRQGKIVKEKELRLLTRPPEFSDAWQVRKFYCYKDNKIVGYVFFDPYFKDGKVVGYCANILRSDTKVKPNGFLDFIVLQAMEVFRQEGIEWVSLGLAPLHNIAPREGEVQWARKMQEFMYEYCGFLYAFKPLAYHKSRYRALERKWFQASKGVNGLKAAILVLLATNVF